MLQDEDKRKLKMAKQEIPEEMKEIYRQLMRPVEPITIQPQHIEIEVKPVQLDIKQHKVAIQHMKVQEQVLRISSETKKLQHD